MRCQICKQHEATIHLTEITDGHRQEVHLCEICAAEQGIAIKSHIPLNEMLSNLLDSQPSEDELTAMTEDQKSCSFCGFSLEDFRKEPLLGCPCDYDMFEAELAPLIERAHEGNNLHCGKVPSKAPLDTKNTTRTTLSAKKLEDAIRIEDYEKAAQLRDKINKMKPKETD